MGKEKFSDKITDLLLFSSGNKIVHTNKSLKLIQKVLQFDFS
jgi:hypothetical protein